MVDVLVSVGVKHVLYCHFPPEKEDSCANIQRSAKLLRVYVLLAWCLKHDCAVKRPHQQGGERLYQIVVD